MLQLALSAILALPALLFTVVLIPVQALLSLPAVYLLRARRAPQSKSSSSTERHVIVMGGSSGIGLAIAQAAAADPSVTRIALGARNGDALRTAAATIARPAGGVTTQRLVVTTHAVDGTDAAAIGQAARKMVDTTSNTRTHVFLCVGAALPQYHDRLTPADMEAQIRVNQLGTMVTAAAFLQVLTRGTLTFTCSMGGLIGVYGYSAYAPTKFALRGYAEALHMEYSLRADRDIQIQIAYPPDTDTPGFAKENATKPAETARISQSTALASAAHVGRIMFRAAIRKRPQFQVYFNLDGFLLSTLCCGFTPVTGLWDAALQVSMLNLTRWIALFYLADWHRLLLNMAKEKEETPAKRGAMKEEVEKEEKVGRSSSSTETPTTNDESIKND